ncbi:hypothetical protein GJ496_007956, partial [Pomphorhynchus laevis]
MLDSIRRKDDEIAMKSNADATEDSIALETNSSSYSTANRLNQIAHVERIDHLYKFILHKTRGKYTGWLFNMNTGEVIGQNKRFKTVLNCYFIGIDGSRFK